MLESLKSRWESSTLGRFVRKYQEDDADTLAALIAFSAVFSLFPLLLGLLTFVGIVLQDQARLDALTTAIQQQFPEGVAELLTFLRETREISGALGLLSVLGLLWAGAALVGSMARAFNRFYRVPDRGFLRQKLVELLVILLFLVLTVVAVVGSSAAAILAELGEELLARLRMEGLPLLHVVGPLLSFVSGLGLFLVLFSIVPNVSLTPRMVWPGALLSTVLFLVILQVFPLYVQLFGGGFEAYKTLGILPLLLTWFYMLARIIVLGAAVNAFRGIGDRGEARADY